MLGFDSGTAVTTGDSNILLGNNAGKAVTTGSQNICIGHNAADANITTADNNIVIGYDTEPSSNSTANEITLGNSSHTKFRIPGINFTVKDTTATEDYVLTVDSNGEAGWEAAGGGAVADGCVYENAQTISNNYTMSTNKNGMSAGPITVSATVTIPSGSSWSIV